MSPPHSELYANSGPKRPPHTHVYGATSYRLLDCNRCPLCVLRIQISVLRRLREAQLEGDNKGRPRDCLLLAMLYRHSVPQAIGARSATSLADNSLFLGRNLRWEGLDPQTGALPILEGWEVAGPAIAASTTARAFG